MLVLSDLGSGVSDRLTASLNAVELVHIRDLLANGVIGRNWGTVVLSDTRSRIVRRNGGTIYCRKYSRLNGLFKKGRQHSATTKFGRIICDTVQAVMVEAGFANNRGFFTSDELPGYHISRPELRSILDCVDASADDLVVILAYDEFQAWRTCIVLEQILVELSHAL